MRRVIRTGPTQLGARMFGEYLPDDVRERALAGKRGSAVAGGHRAKDAGDAFEAWLDDQHKAAQVARVAVVRKVGPPIAFTGRGGVDIKVVGKGPADFQGAIRGAPGAPWRTLAVEAKSHVGRLQRRQLAAHQRDDLALVERVFGGVALVLIELRDDEDRVEGMWAVPWGHLETLWRRTKRTVKVPAKGNAAPTTRVDESFSVGPEELRGWEVGAQSIYLERWAGGAR